MKIKYFGLKSSNCCSVNTHDSLQWAHQCTGHIAEKSYDNQSSLSQICKNMHHTVQHFGVTEQYIDSK